MFKRSRRRIVASILATLVLLLFGTICVIYLASYADMTSKNQWLLKQYVETYSLSGKGEPDAPAREPASGTRVPPPRLELSTFYSVALSKDGELLKADTADVASIDEAALVQLAAEIIESGRTEGVEQNLIYRAADKGGYDLVAFLDNTVMRENTATLINYTLIFGSAALAPLFFLARWLAGRIVAPLEESYRRQKQFVSDAGHELKTPVTILKGQLAGMLEGVGVYQDRDKYLLRSLQTTGRMERLIGEMLSISRMESGSAAVRQEPVDLSALMAQQLALDRELLEQRGQQLVSALTPGITVPADASLLGKAVGNLLSNASRYSPEGAEIRVWCGRLEGRPALSVENTGARISGDALPHLFEAFDREEGSRNRSTGGSGLGLYLVKMILDRHGAVCTIENTEEGVKATVRF